MKEDNAFAQIHMENMVYLPTVIRNAMETLVKYAAEHGPILYIQLNAPQVEFI
jgi:hypothetical protein